MTRFKKELIKRGVILEETVPHMPYDYYETIIVHSDECKVAYYHVCIGWMWDYYDRSMNVYKTLYEDDDFNI